MNPCERADSLLSFYVEEELSPAENKFVSGHLVACSRCRQSEKDLRLVMKQIQHLPKATVSDGFTERVLDNALGRAPAGIEEPVYETRSSFVSQWGAPVAMAAALGIVAFLGLTQFGPRSGDVFRADNVTSTPVEGENAALDQDALDQNGTPSADLSADVDNNLTSEENRAFATVSAPHLQPLSDSPPTTLGTQYVLEDWVLSEPTGGGDRVLTRVGTEKSDRVLVTF